MQLEFSEDQEQLRDSVRAVLARECPSTRVRAVFDGQVPRDVLWPGMVELGWPAVAVPESDGGLGLSFVEVAVVLDELGRAAAPGPFTTTVSQFLPALVDAAPTPRRAEWIESVLAGAVTGALADGDVVSAASAAGRRLDGIARGVLGAGDVSHYAVVADGGASLFVVAADAPGVSIVPADPVDRTRGVGALVLDGVEVEPDAALGGAGDAARLVARVREQAACGLALELLGVCDAIFTMTLEYAKVREQFGRPIGSFQAIKHKLADCYVALQRANALCYFAALTIAEDDTRRRLAVSMAKAGAGDCHRIVTREGLQIHGGIGYTWEHDLHLFLRRAKTLDACCGTSRSHRGRVADLLGL